MLDRTVLRSVAASESAESQQDTSNYVPLHRQGPLDPGWLTGLASLAEDGPVHARHVANSRIAAAVLGIGGEDWALARPATRPARRLAEPQARADGLAAAVRPAGDVGTLLLDVDGGLARLDTPPVTRRSEQGDVWVFDYSAESLEGLPARGSHGELLTWLRAADDAVAVGLMRAACVAAAREVTKQRDGGWPDQLRETIAADLCLEHASAVALAMGSATACVPLTTPAREFVSALSRYWTARSARRIAAHRASSSVASWPELDPTAVDLLRHAVTCSVSGGSSDQVLADVDRALSCSPSILDELFILVQGTIRQDRLLDAHVRRLRRHLLRASGTMQASPHVVREIALLLQAAFVVQSCPTNVAEAFLRTRLGPEPLPHLAQGLDKSLQEILLARL